jgi:replication factor C subunit 3/5
MEVDNDAAPGPSAAKDNAAAAAAAAPAMRTDPTVGGKGAPWVEKYRPKTLDDVAAHGEIVDTIRRLTAENRLPHLLLYGPPGTGKTSTILAVARQIYGKALQNMTLELNASDERGIDVVRQQIQDFASTRSVFSNTFKLIILDECDAMTKDAQFALRRVIEKYTRNARFCLICNYVIKIIPALQSRCTRFRFPPLPPQHVRARLEHVVAAEGVRLGPGGMDALVTLGAGDMRRSLNILQSASMAFPEVDADAVYLTTGAPLPRDVEAVVGWLLNEDFNVAFDRIAQLQVDKGVALVDIVRELHPWLFNIESLGPPGVRITLVEKLADIEHRLSAGTSERLQLGSLVAAFALARDEIVAAAR